MGCAASTTVNTADDVKPMIDAINSDFRQSPKLNANSGDLEVNDTTNYGDKIEENKNIVEESNFHNSPAMSAHDRKSVFSSSGSISNVNKCPESVQRDNDDANAICKSEENVVSSPVINKSNAESDDVASKPMKKASISSPVSNNCEKVNETCSTLKNDDVELTDEINSQGEIQRIVKDSERVYEMTSQQSIRSMTSSQKSNIVYKPTTPSDEEQKPSKRNSRNLKDSKEELNHVNNSTSVVSESKTAENQGEDYWNQEPKHVSIANSLNNIDCDKSSRNSRFSHTLTGSVHSPFFDSLNHGNTNFEIEENQNHDELTETINDRLIQGTGDSEKWTEANQNHQSDTLNEFIVESGGRPLFDNHLMETPTTNLSATGDMCFELLEQTNEENILEIENNPTYNYVIGDQKKLSEQEPCNSFEVGNKHSVIMSPISNDHLNTKMEYLKTAEVNDSNCEGMLIGLTSSPLDFNVEPAQEPITMIEQDCRNDVNLKERIVEMDEIDKDDGNLSENKSPIVAFPSQQDKRISPMYNGNDA